MSSWGKWLAPITVPTGGWAFEWGDTSDASITVTVPAGTYATILELAEALETEMDSESTSDILVSSTGYVSIACMTMTSIGNSCSADLLSTLGYAGTETVANPGAAGANVTATSAHRYGWYPGTMTFGVARGDGVVSDTSWRPVDEVGRIVSGSGQMRAIAPARRRYEREVRYGAIRRTEYEDRYCGVALLEDYAATLEMRWYPDRDDGTVDDAGTQGDPADSRLDSSCDYWLVTLTSPPAIEWSSQHPDYASVALAVNGEPAEEGGDPA